MYPSKSMAREQRRGTTAQRNERKNDCQRKRFYFTPRFSKLRSFSSLDALEAGCVLEFLVFLVFGTPVNVAVWSFYDTSKAKSRKSTWKLSVRISCTNFCIVKSLILVQMGTFAPKIENSRSCASNTSSIDFSGRSWRARPRESPLNWSLRFLGGMKFRRFRQTERSEFPFAAWRCWKQWFVIKGSDKSW